MHPWFRSPSYDWSCELTSSVAGSMRGSSVALALLRTKSDLPVCASIRTYVDLTQSLCLVANSFRRTLDDRFQAVRGNLHPDAQQDESHDTQDSMDRRRCNFLCDSRSIGVAEPKGDSQSRNRQSHAKMA